MPTCIQRGDLLLRSLKWYKSLLINKHRRAEGCFLVEGFRAIEQIAAEFPESIDEIILSEKRTDWSMLKKFQVRTLSEAQLNSISPSQTPQGIIAAVHLPDKCYSSELPDNFGSKILLLEHIQDPGNVGTLIRTAAAMGYSGVLLSAQSADPFSPKAVQSSAGAILSVWIRRTESYLNVISRLKTEKFSICAADVYGQNHIDFSKVSKHVLTLGNEGAGLTSALLQLSDVRFRIPFDSSKVESLNVAISGAIAMFCSANKVAW